MALSPLTGICLPWDDLSKAGTTLTNRYISLGRTPTVSDCRGSSQVAEGLTEDRRDYRTKKGRNTRIWTVDEVHLGLLGTEIQQFPHARVYLTGSELSA